MKSLKTQIVLFLLLLVPGTFTFAGSMRSNAKGAMSFYSCPSVIIQAEDGSLTNATVESEHAGYNGTGYVNFSTTDSYAEFGNIDGGSGGDFILTYRYALGSDTDRTGLLVVNGVSQSLTAKAQGDGNWGTWVTGKVLVPLDGTTTNTIRFEANGDDFFNLDEFTLEEVSEDTVTIQAEDGSLTNATVESEHAGYNGTGYVNFSTTDSYAEFTGIDGCTGGDFILTYRYALGSDTDRTGLLVVNGVSQSLTAKAQGNGNWATWVTGKVLVPLDGTTTNTIRFEANGEDFFNLDEFTLEEAPEDTEPPTAPSNLTASNITSTSVDLDWDASTDNVILAGYRIYKDGSFLAEVTDRTYYEASGLSPETSYLFEVSAFDAAGNESGTSGITVTTSAPTSADKTLFDFYGIQEGSNTEPSKAESEFNELGARWVRIFYNIYDWSERSLRSGQAGILQKAKNYKGRGFKVILILNANGGVMPDTSTAEGYTKAKGYFDFLQQQDGAEAVDMWEILNEINLDKYWDGTEKQYVDMVLKAAWDSFKPNGETVLGGSFTLFQDTWGGTEVTQRLVDAGYLNYCDYANAHPYATNFTELKKFTNDVLAIYGDKPVIISEWNYHPDRDYTTWQEWADATDQAREYFASQSAIQRFVYYRFLESSGEGGWPGLMQGGAEYVPQLPFYNMYKSWPKTPDAANTPPGVALIAPADGSQYTSGDDVVIEADASDSDGTVAEVSFYYNGNQLIGTDTNGGDGWSVTWQNIPPGSFVLSVVAKDDGGALRGDYGTTIDVEANTTGEVISVNFKGLGPELTVSEVAGLVPRAWWNNTYNTTTTSGLLDENGDNTGAQISNTLSSNYQSSDDTTTADFKMMKGYVAHWGSDTKQITVESLPPIFAGGTYDVYLYWGNKDTSDDAVRYYNGSETLLIRDDNDVWSGAHVVSRANSLNEAAVGSNVAVFKGMSGGSFSINVKALNTKRNGVSGLQIVKTGVSPPLGSVNVVSPSDGATFKNGDVITIEADPLDFGEPVEEIAFYADDNQLIGTDTDSTGGWSIEWSQASAGSYELSAIARSASGGVLSPPVNITVEGPSSFMIYPGEGSVFDAGNQIELEAGVANFGSEDVQQVAFYNDGDELIGTDTDSTGGWTYSWSDVPSGAYTLTAVATGTGGTETGSEAVHIRVRTLPEYVISINFKGTGPALSPGDTAGAVPAPYWNNTENDTTTEHLMDATGADIGASITNNISANYRSFDDTTNADYKMMKGYVAHWGSESKQITVSNLPSSFISQGYDVYLFWGNKDTDDDVVSYTLADTTYYLRDANEQWDGFHSRSKAGTQNEAVTGKSFVLIEGLQDTSFTVDVTAYNTFRGGVSGIQIVARQITTTSVAGDTPLIAAPEIGRDNLPEKFSLDANYPNPFNPETVIRYALPEQAQVRLEVFDILGRRVAMLVDEQQTAGIKKVRFNGLNLSSGVYLYRLQAGGQVFIRKMLLIK